MTQYNLIHTGILQSNTVSGTGNKSLSNYELLALYDGNTTLSGVPLLESDVLYLDVDMGYRIRVDAVKLYVTVPGDRGTALTNVSFYYKNTSLDVYTECTKNYDSTAFYITGLPELFAPRYLRVVINNQEADIYELEILNDDTQVSFGENGGESLVILNQTVDGYTELGIFNNSSVGTQSINAYVIVDYQGNSLDYYLKLATAADGPYYGLMDGISISDNDLSKTYRWGSGSMTGVISDTDNAVLENYSNTAGYYITPVISMEDKLSSTFVFTNFTTYSGTNVTCTDSFPGGSLYLRSSNTEPTPFTKLFWAHTVDNTGSSNMYVGDLSTGYIEESYYTTMTDAAKDVAQIKADRWRGKVYILYKDAYSQYAIYRYDYISKTCEVYSSMSSYNFFTYWDIDSDGCVWGYVKSSGFKLVYFDYNLVTRTTLKEDSASDFLGGMSACKNYPSCWYTDAAQNKLEHINYSGDTIVSIAIDAPGKITSLPDGGCFVVSHGSSKLIRYSYYGSEISSISYSSSFTVTDLSFGTHALGKQPFNTTILWVVMDSSRLLQLDYDGNTISSTELSGISAIEAIPGGCIVYRGAAYKAVQVNADGATAYIWDFSKYSIKCGTPYPVVIYYDEFIGMTEATKILPITTDPIWGGDTGWKVVPLNGEKLPFYKYHQMKFKLIPIGFSGVLTNPGAELGTVAGWTQGSGGYPMTVTTAQKYSGSYSFVSGGGTSSLYQIINLTLLPNISMTSVVDSLYIAYASIMIKSAQSYLIYITDISLSLSFLNYSSELISSVSSATELNSSWEKVQIRCRIPSNTYYIKVAFSQTSLYAVGQTWFDDISFDIFMTPSLNSIIIPTPIIVNDIQPQEFKNVYIKTDMPASAESGDYEAGLKCWWGNEDN